MVHAYITDRRRAASARSGAGSGRRFHVPLVLPRHAPYRARAAGRAGARIAPRHPLAWLSAAARSGAGLTVELAERSLEDAGEALGLRFDFARIATVPDTLHAHRLVLLASGEGRQAAVIDALFRAYFEQGRDIGDLQELVSIGAAQGLSPSVLQDLVRVSAGSDNGADLVSDTVVAEELRLRSLGVQNVPNLLLNGHVLVPGPAEVDTYVQALDQVLFPVAGAAEAPPRLH
jgi:predicted DsbA family dithiol-disulfide isomerase